ncbi:hypothetical protein Ancab_019368 [Ancistrocladus abbreviatus]
MLIETLKGFKLPRGDLRSTGINLQLIEFDDDAADINEHEIQDKVSQWQHVLVDYVVGSRVPQTDMVNYFQSQWREFASPKVSVHGKGLLVFHFNTEESRGLLKMVSVLQLKADQLEAVVRRFDTSKDFIDTAPT